MSELFSNRVLSTIQSDHLPKVVDTALDKNVMFQRSVRVAKKFEGRKIEQPVKFEKNSTFGYFAGGSTHDTTITNNRVKMEYFPRFTSITSHLTVDELAVAVNAGDQEIIKYLDVTLQSDVEDMADSLGTEYFTADASTVAGLTKFTGLAAGVDDGGAVANIGGLSRSTYTTLQATDTSGSAGLSLALMDTAWNAASFGSSEPTILPTTRAIFSLYGQLVGDTLRTNRQVTAAPVANGKGMIGGLGFTGLDYKGRAVVADPKEVSGLLHMLNEDNIQFYAMEKWPDAEPVRYKSQIDGNDYSDVMGLGFHFGGWIKSQNSSDRVAFWYFAGEWVHKSPRTQVELNTITALA